MPYSRPTLTQLRAQAAADINTSLPGADGLLRYSNLGVLGDLTAKGANALFGYLDWIAAMAVPFTATDEYLEGWAGLKGITRAAATLATGAVSFTAQPNTLVPAGTPINRSDGAGFVTSADANSGAGTSVVCPAVATTAGSAGNTDVGVGMTLGVGIAGVTAAGAVSTEFTGGADVQTDDELRAEMLQAFASTPMGGASSDYVDWALAVPGVTRAWCSPNAMGAGTVVVYTMFDEAEQAHAGFPQGTDGVAAAEPRSTMTAAGDQLEVANAIFALQPVTALIYAVAPKPNQVTFDISLPGASATVRSAVDAAIADVLQQQGAPGGSVLLSYIEAAIAAIAGTAGFVITGINCSNGTVTLGPTGNIASAAGYLPTAQSIVWS